MPPSRRACVGGYGWPFRSWLLPTLVALCAPTSLGDGAPVWDEMTQPFEQMGVPSWVVAAGLGAVGTGGAVVPYARQLEGAGARAISLTPAAALGGLVGSTIETGDYAGAAAKLSNFVTPSCPQTRFRYPWFGVTMGGTISATLPGWEAKVMCDGDNYYTGPAIACRRTSTGVLGATMDDFEYVRKEDLQHEGSSSLVNGKALLAQQLRCSPQYPSDRNQYQSGRQLQSESATEETDAAWVKREATADEEALREAEEKAIREFTTWYHGSRHTGAKLFVSISLSAAFAVGVYELIFCLRQRHSKSQTRSSYQQLDITNQESATDLDDPL